MSTPSSKPQLSLQVTIQVAPENADAFLAALRPCWEAVIAEPECLFFDVFQDPEVPGKFRFIELWAESREWLETVSQFSCQLAECIQCADLWISCRNN